MTRWPRRLTGTASRQRSGWESATGNAIWATALFLPLTTLVLGLLGPLRRALVKLGDAQGLSVAEREAKAALDLAEAGTRRHDLAVRKGAVESEAGMERARLAAETAQYETDAEAARQCLTAAVEARQVALRARADAEAELAPEAARKALEGDAGEQMAALSGAYAAYCAAREDRPWAFGQWIQGFEGVPRA